MCVLVCFWCYIRLSNAGSKPDHLKMPFKKCHDNFDLTHTDAIMMRVIKHLYCQVLPLGQ